MSVLAKFMNVETLAPIIIVATLSLMGNILYFNYRFKKERKKELLRETLTQLLLPLYVILKRDELEFYEWQNNDDADMAEYASDMPERLMSKVYPIIEKNLHLADSDLFTGCLQFLEWGHRSDSNQRFQRIHTGALKEDRVLDEFKELIYSKFAYARKDYLET